MLLCPIDIPASLPRAERNRILSKASDDPWPSVPFAANPPARSMVLLPGAPLHLSPLSFGRAWLAHWAHTTPRFPAYPRPGAPLHRLALSPGRAWLAHWAQNKKDRSAAICLFCLMVYVKRLAPQSGGLSLYGCIIPRLCGMGLSCL